MDIGHQLSLVTEEMMASAAERLGRGADIMGDVIYSCSRLIGEPYLKTKKMERVRFSATLDQAFRHGIPAPLLVLMLRLNKEGPNRRDIFRAPGHQPSIKKLIYILHSGRLVNFEFFSIYTVASLIKKFLRKIPGGIFTKQGELRLFEIIEMTDVEQQRDEIFAVISALSVHAQEMLVLLFGTFRSIANNMDKENPSLSMSSEALGVSVAPSFFKTLVGGRRIAKMEDVLKFKVAIRIVKFIIDNFGVSNLFGRENYEFYARITGRILRIDEDWIFAFERGKQEEAPPMGKYSNPALLEVLEEEVDESIADEVLLKVATRFSISLEQDLNEILSVYDRQILRMKARSDWFLAPDQANAVTQERDQGQESESLKPHVDVIVSSANSNGLRRRGSKEKKRRRVRRQAKNKENGTLSPSRRQGHGQSQGQGQGLQVPGPSSPKPSTSKQAAAAAAASAANCVPGPSSSLLGGRKNPVVMYIFSSPPMSPCSAYLEAQKAAEEAEELGEDSESDYSEYDEDDDDEEYYDEKEIETFTISIENTDTNPNAYKPRI